jgi:hypothetical protein
MIQIFVIIFIIFFTGIYSDDNIVRFHQQGKTDEYGRKYFLKWNGEINFKIDSAYYAVFPNLKLLHLHDIEANELEKSGKLLEALELRKNISVCIDLLTPEQKPIYDNVILNNSKSLGKILSNYKDRLKNKEHLLDPNYCKKEEDIFFSSNDFTLKGVIPNKYFQSRFSDYKVKYGSNLESSWRVINFNELSEIKEENLELENALEIWENLENNKIKNNASITLAFSRHPLDILSYDFLEKYWDFKRGLTENQKNVLQFSRKENGIIKETEYTIKNDTNSKTFIGYEIYLFSKRTGTSIFFNFPKDKKETYSSVWENLKNSLYFRGQKLAEK